MRVLAGKRDTSRQLAHEFDDLCDMIVVFAIPLTRCGIKEVIASRQQLKDLNHDGEPAFSK